MLSLFTIKNSAQACNYYEADNYYAKEAGDTCQWWGKGAQVLGLSGTVDPRLFKQLLEGRLTTGQQLGLGKDGGINHRPGYDLTFSAPKSVSILAEVGGDKRIHAFHTQAVNAALSLMQAQAAQTRIRENGSIHFVKTDNLVVAQFQHNLSRALDPQLHTHCVVLNMTQQDNGQWRSLSSEELYNLKMLGGLWYRAVLAYELKQSGYSLIKTHADGRFEVKDIPQAALESLSKRRQDIVQAMTEWGLIGAKAAETATLLTRERKQTIEPQALHQYWQQELQHLEVDVSTIIAKAKAPERTALYTSIELAKEAVNFASRHCSEREAVINQQDLLRVALARHLGDVLPQHIEAAIDTLQAKRQLIPVSTQPSETKSGLTKESVFTPKPPTHWTTPAAIKLEQATLNRMLEGKLDKKPIAREQEASRFLNSQQLPLNQGQRGAAMLIATTYDRVVGIQGYAGTGKTTLLATVKAFAEQQGYCVQGLAPSAAAANQLREQAGIESKTLSSHLIGLEKAANEKQTQSHNAQAVSAACSKELWILDESSLASTQQIHDVLQHAQQQDARLVLVGDGKQLGAVEAGKPFVQLQQAGMATAIMDDILRQHNPELRQAVYASIAGDMKAALDKIGDNIIEIAHKEERLAQLAGDYLALVPSQRQQTLVLASTQKDCIALNHLVREGLKQEGLLTGKETQQTILLQRDLTREQKTCASHYEVGNTIRFNRAYSSLGVQAGDYLKVTHIDTENNQLTLHNQQQKAINWQPQLVGGKRQGAVEVYATEARSLMAGDSIRWLRNDAKQGLTNAETAQVLAVNDKQVQLELANKATLTLNMQQPSAQHWEHAYASTVHAVQGKTCHTVLAQVESFQRNLTNQHALYVTISRAQEAAYLYTDDKTQLLNTLQKYIGAKTSALDAIEHDVSKASKGFSQKTDILHVNQTKPILNKDWEREV